MWYQNIRSALFSFVTIHASDGRTDGQTDRQNSDSNAVRCITCSRTVNKGLANAKRPCDCRDVLCLRLKSSLCSCQHCQWFCVRRDAITIRQARITRPKRHLPNAYEILVTRYDQFRTGWITFGEYLTGKRASLTNHCWRQKTGVIAV